MGTKLHGAPMAYMQYMYGLDGGGSVMYLVPQIPLHAYYRYMQIRPADPITWGPF